MPTEVANKHSPEIRLARTVQSLLWLVLVVYLAWLSAQGVWQVMVKPDAGVLVLSPVEGVSSAGTSSKHTMLPALHLFGKEGLKPVVKSDVPKEAPKTSLRLMLKGVFTGDQGGESGAIIEEIGRSTDYYRLGDNVPGNATLEEVYSDRVLLRRSGKLETLAFEDSVSGGSSIARVTVARPERTAPDTINTPDQFIEEATRRLTEDPEQALKSVGLAPGDGGGYVYQGKNPMLQGLNLEKGDVILSVNGHTLGDVQKDKELMKSLYEQGSVEVEVVRDGASFYVSYPLR